MDGGFFINLDVVPHLPGRQVHADGTEGTAAV
jgi:hypothetical protein